MPTPDNDQTVQRRIILRRSRGGGGFSASTSTRSESLRAPEEPDEVDDAVDPVQMQQNIRTGVAPISPIQPVTPDRENPRSRLNAVGASGSSTYAKEYRLDLLHRMLMRNVPLDQIARELQVSISTVEKDRAELRRRMRDNATKLNIDEMVGGQMAVYDEIQGMAMRVASGNGEGAAPTPMKLAAMRTALAAGADRTRFLASAGVFDVLKFRRADDGSNVSDVQRLMERTLEMMAALNEPDETSTPRAPAPRTAGAFQPMTFDDADSSNSTSEIQEL